MAVTQVELFGANGFYACLAGEGAGEQGVILYQNGFNGFSDSPITAEYKSGAFQVGGTLAKVSRPLRRVTLTLGVFADEPFELLDIENQVKESIGAELDKWDPDAAPARLDVNVDGQTWSLDLFLSETVETPMESDPFDDCHMIITIQAVAPNPDWYAADWAGDATHPISWTCTGTSGSGSVWVYNPGPLPMHATWYILGQGTVTLPDRSWTGAFGSRVPGVDFRTGRNDSTRTLPLPAITNATHGGAAWVTSDPMRIPIEDYNDTLSLVAALGGKRLLYAIPPGTPMTALPVSATAATTGLTVTLIQPQRHKRPWGTNTL